MSSLPASHLLASPAPTSLDDADGLLSPHTMPLQANTPHPLPSTTSLPDLHARRSRSVAFHVSADASPSGSRWQSPDARRKPASAMKRAVVSPIRDEGEGQEEEDVDADADADVNETTAMVGRESGGVRGYNTQDAAVVTGQRMGSQVVQRKQSARARLQGQMDGMQGERAQQGGDAEAPALNGWWSKLLDKYGSVELENKGSVARDHLALERTFLAWLRTSLSFASIGIAVTQLFRLNVSINADQPTDAQVRLRHIGKPLGATFLAVGILTLFIGFHRYFESQHYVILGKFPASRGSVIIVATMSAALIVASFVTIIVIGNVTRTPI